MAPEPTRTGECESIIVQCTCRAERHRKSCRCQKCTAETPGRSYDFIHCPMHAAAPELAAELATERALLTAERERRERAEAAIGTWDEELEGEYEWGVVGGHEDFMSNELSALLTRLRDYSKARALEEARAGQALSTTKKESAEVEKDGN